MPRLGISIETQSRLVVAQGWDWEQGVAIEMRFLLGVMKMYWNYIVVMVVQLCKYTKNIEMYT